MAARKRQRKGGRRDRPGGERRRRYGVAYRFGLVVSATIAVFMIVFGAVNTISAVSTLNAEIDESGRTLARMLAVPDLETWTALSGTSAAGDPSAVEDGFRPKDEADRQRFQINVHRLEGLITGTSSLIDAFILSKDQKRVIRGARQGEVGRVGFDAETSRSVGETRIEYGTVRFGSARESGRLFRHPIHVVPSDPKSPVVGYSAVILSESRISDRVRTLLSTTAVLTVLFIALAFVVARYTARRVTQPLRELTRDVEIIASGNLSHHTSVRSNDEIGTLARTFDEMTKNLREAQRTEIEHRARLHEVKVVNEITSHLLPTDMPQPPGIELDGLYQPSREVGGDYYDAFELGEAHLGLVVAHAPVSGVPGAMIMTMARSILGVEARRTLSPAATLRQTNHFLAPDLRRGLYVDCLYAVLDLETRALQVASAGQCVLLRRTAASGAIEKIHTDGFALGFDRGPVFDRRLNEVRLSLGAGDRICLCTAGMLSLKNAAGEEFGERRLGLLMKQEAETSSAGFVAKLRQSIDAFTGGGAPAADLTVLTLRATSGGSS